VFSLHPSAAAAGLVEAGYAGKGKGEACFENWMPDSACLRSDGKNAPVSAADIGADDYRCD
jgi:hypothetical protein